MSAAVMGAAELPREHETRWAWCGCKPSVIAYEEHVYPVGDLVFHDLSGACWCVPASRRQGGMVVWVHHAADRREVLQSATGDL